MEPRNRRRCVIGVTAAALAVTGVVLVGGAADSRAGEMRSWMAAAEAAWDARDFSRPALWGDTADGSAFAHYDEALRLASDLLQRKGEDQALIALRLHPEKLGEDDETSLRARWAPAIAAMRIGAHCADARSPARFEDGFRTEATNLLSGRWIQNTACIEARELLAADRGREAVEYTLDGATFGADLLNSPMLIDQMIAAALITIATSEFWTAERLAQLDDHDLELLAQGLRRLDEALPLTLDLTGEALLLAHTLAAASGPGALELSGAATWRYGFSTRWMGADAVLEIGRTMDRLASSAERPWHERERALRDATEQLNGSTNAIVRISWPMLLTTEASAVRPTVATVRMLRVAVEVQRGRPVPALQDPLGDGPLEVVETADGARVVSAGMRGGKPIEQALPRPAPR